MVKFVQITHTSKKQKAMADRSATSKETWNESFGDLEAGKWPNFEITSEKQLVVASQPNPSMVQWMDPFMQSILERLNRLEHENMMLRQQVSCVSTNMMEFVRSYIEKEEILSSSQSSSWDALPLAKSSSDPPVTVNRPNRQRINRKPLMANEEITKDSDIMLLHSVGATKAAYLAKVGITTVGMLANLPSDLNSLQRIVNAMQRHASKISRQVMSTNSLIRYRADARASLNMD